MQRVLGVIVRGYLALMAGDAGAAHAAAHGVVHRPAVEPPVRDKWELAAGTAATRYRGLGIVVAALSAVVLLLAILPTVLGLSGMNAVALKASKLGVMAAVVLLVLLAARANRWRKAWVIARRRAQRNGSAALRGAVRALVANPGAVACAQSLRLQCEQLLVGQIAYNRSTAHRYHAIEHRTERFTYGAFALSFIVAGVDAALAVFTLNAAHPAKWPLLFTAFLPGLVGLVHGVNGFLGIGEQAFSTQLMAQRLEELQRELAAADPSHTLKLLRITDETLRLLEGHDRVWASSIKLPTV